MVFSSFFARAGSYAVSHLCLAVFFLMVTFGLNLFIQNKAMAQKQAPLQGEAPVISAEEAKALIEKADKLLRGESNHSTLTMIIETPRWKRTLKMENWAKGTKHSLIRIHSPAKEAGTGSLKIDRDMWNYLPKVDRVVRIPPSMMLQSWMGSDFTNDDLVKESSIVEDYTHSFVSAEGEGKDQLVVIELIPKPDAPVVWGKILFTVIRTSAIPVREEFYSEHGKLIKVMVLSDIKEMDGRLLPTKWVMTPLNKEGNSTTIIMDDIDFDLELKDSIFSLQELRRYRR